MAEPDGTKQNPYLKDPDAKLDYGVNWESWLAGDTISVSAWDVQTGITQTTPAPSVNVAGTITTIWLLGGTIATVYAVRNRITTAAGRINDRTIYIWVKHL